MKPKLLPYPQSLRVLPGRLAVGQPRFVTVGRPTETRGVAMASLRSYLPRSGPAMRVRLGCVAEGPPPAWISATQRAFLARPDTSDDAYVLTIAPEGITIVGKGWLTAGKPLRIEVKLPAGAGDWFMVHEFADPDSPAALAVTPKPRMPAIAAFTPYRDGAAGVTGAEFDMSGSPGARTGQVVKGAVAAPPPQAGFGARPAK